MAQSIRKTDLGGVGVFLLLLLLGGLLLLLGLGHLRRGDRKKYRDQMKESQEVAAK